MASRDRVSASATSCTAPRSQPPSCPSPRRARRLPAPTPAADPHAASAANGTAPSRSKIALPLASRCSVAATAETERARTRARRRDPHSAQPVSGLTVAERRLALAPARLGHDRRRGCERGSGREISAIALSRAPVSSVSARSSWPAATQTRRQSGSRRGTPVRSLCAIRPRTPPRAAVASFELPAERAHERPSRGAQDRAPEDRRSRAPAGERSPAHRSAFVDRPRAARGPGPRPRRPCTSICVPPWLRSQREELIGFSDELVPLPELVERTRRRSLSSTSRGASSPRRRANSSEASMSSRDVRRGLERGDHLAEIEVGRPCLDPETEPKERSSAFAQVLETHRVAELESRDPPHLEMPDDVLDARAHCASAIPFSAHAIASSRPPADCVHALLLARRRRRAPGPGITLENRHRLERQLAAPSSLSMTPERSSQTAACAKAAARSSPAERSAASASSYTSSASGRRPCSSTRRRASTRTTALAAATRPTAPGTLRYAASAAAMSRRIARSPARMRKRAEPGLEVRARCAPAARPELERLLVVVDEDLRMVGDALVRLGFDPVSCQHVLAARAARGNLLVRDVADEHVPERELLLLAHRRDAGRPHELAPHEVSQAREHVSRDRSPIAARAPVQKTFPRTDASWRSAFSSGPSVSSRAAISACTVSGSDMPRPSPRGRRACARTARCRAGCRRRARAGRPASRPRAPTARAARRRDARCPRPRAARDRLSPSYGVLRPSPAVRRGARVGPSREP